MKLKSLASGQVKAVKDNHLDGIATRLEVDRDGEVVVPSGADLSAFRNNPVVLWAHNHQFPPIGKVLSIEANEVEMPFAMEFAQTQFAQDVRSLYADGILNAFSIAFMPKADGVINESVMQGQSGVTFKAWELLELSAVPVPSLRSALVQRSVDNKAADLILKHYYPDSEPRASASGLPLSEDQKFALELEQTSKRLNQIISISRHWAKEGRVLSAENARLVSAAIEALQRLLDAARREENHSEIMQQVKDLESHLNRLEAGRSDAIRTVVDSVFNPLQSTRS